MGAPTQHLARKTFVWSMRANRTDKAPTSKADLSRPMWSYARSNRAARPRVGRRAHAGNMHQDFVLATPGPEQCNRPSSHGQAERQPPRRALVRTGRITENGNHREHPPAPPPPPTSCKGRNRREIPLPPYSDWARAARRNAPSPRRPTCAAFRLATGAVGGGRTGRDGQTNHLPPPHHRRDCHRHNT